VSFRLRQEKFNRLRALKWRNEQWIRGDAFVVKLEEVASAGDYDLEVRTRVQKFLQELLELFALSSDQLLCVVEADQELFRISIFGKVMIRVLLNLP
jgi:hypothetical protein